jgi:GTP-binding protein
MINNAFYLVDLPGYGYAKVSHDERKHWKPMIERYVASRKTLTGMVIISDIRRIPGIEEIELSRWLAYIDIPAIWVLSKADKLSKNEQFRQRQAVAKTLSVSRENLIVFSAKTRQGMELLWERMEETLYIKQDDMISETLPISPDTLDISENMPYQTKEQQ